MRPEAWADEGAEFDLSARAAGQDPPIAGLVVVAILCTPLLAFGAVCLVNIVRLHPAGHDTLVVDGAGLRRTSRVRGFDVSWPEVDRVEVIATEGVAGYWSWGLDGGRRRAAGTLTVLPSTRRPAHADGPAEHTAARGSYAVGR